MILKKEALKEIIKDELIKIVFQPVISLTNGEVLGYEALSRITTKTIFKSIEDLFETAIAHDLIWDLERLSRTKALEAAKEFMVPPYNQKLFLNVHPKVMYDEKFIRNYRIFSWKNTKFRPIILLLTLLKNISLKAKTAFKLQSVSIRARVISSL